MRRQLTVSVSVRTRPPWQQALTTELSECGNSATPKLEQLWSGVYIVLELIHIQVKAHLYSQFWHLQMCRNDKLWQLLLCGWFHLKV